MYEPPGLAASATGTKATLQRLVWRYRCSVEVRKQLKHTGLQPADGIDRLQGLTASSIVKVVSGWGLAAVPGVPWPVSAALLGISKPQTRPTCLTYEW